MVMAVVMVVPVPFPLKFYPCPSSWSQVRRIPGCIIYPIGLDAETDGFPEDFLWNATQFPHCHWLYHHVCMFLFMFTPVSHGSIHHQLFFNVPRCWCHPRFLAFRMIPGFHMVAFGLWVHVSTWGVSHGPSIPVVMRVMHVSQPLTMCGRWNSHAHWSYPMCSPKQNCFSQWKPWFSRASHHFP